MTGEVGGEAGVLRNRSRGGGARVLVTDGKRPELGDRLCADSAFRQRLLTQCHQSCGCQWTGPGSPPPTPPEQTSGPGKRGKCRASWRASCPHAFFLRPLPHVWTLYSETPCPHQNAFSSKKPSLTASFWGPLPSLADLCFFRAFLMSSAL